MSYFFLDTSALVKRYVQEYGTPWIVALTSQQAENTIIVAEVTEVEAAAAIAAKHRASNGITRQERDDAVALLAAHRATEYRTIPINRSIIDRAIVLTQKHRLRGYDAIQLATALVVYDRAMLQGFSKLTFVTSDSDLIQAAQNEGLPTDNPNRHASG